MFPAFLLAQSQHSQRRRQGCEFLQVHRDRHIYVFRVPARVTEPGPARRRPDDYGGGSLITLRVVPVPVLALMKMAAFLDSPYGRQ